MIAFLKSLVVYEHREMHFKNACKLRSLGGGGMKFNECLLNNWLLFQLMALCSIPGIKCQVLGKGSKTDNNNYL